MLKNLFKWFMAPVMPLYFGGGSKSNANTTTSNQTTNNAMSIDKRAVASDNAVSLTGNGNTVDRSTTSWTDSSTSMVDNSNRSTSTITQMFDKSSRDNSTHFSDSSTTDNSTYFSDSSSRDQSTHFSDSSSRDQSTHFTDNSTKDNSTYFSDSSVRDSSTHFADSSVKTSLDSHNTSMVDNSNRSVTYSSTDYGSVGKALDSIGMMSSKSLDVAAGGVNGALDALKYIADKNQQSVSLAFDLTKAAGANSATNSAAVLGFANSAIAKSAEAFAEAKDGGESKNIMYALAAIAAIGVAFALKS